MISSCSKTDWLVDMRDLHFSEGVGECMGRSLGVGWEQRQEERGNWDQSGKIN